MSVKAMALVWDLKCPQKIGDLEFKPNHKYTLIAYADHADHNGKNIYPAVYTIAEKTGLDDRTVQRMTHDLETMGLLIDDGRGPRGTNKWKLPYNSKGDSLTPLMGDSVTGDKNDKSLGDNSSGDNSSGDSLTDESKELNQSDIDIFYKEFDSVWVKFKTAMEAEFRRAEFQTWIEPTKAVGFEDRTLIVDVKNSYTRGWLEKNLKEIAQNDLGVYVKFVVPEAEAENE